MNRYRQLQARHEKLMAISRQLSSTFDLDALLNQIIDCALYGVCLFINKRRKPPRRHAKREGDYPILVWRKKSFFATWCVGQS